MQRFAQRVLGALAGIYLLAYVLVAVVRITYPFELEFLEGTSVTLISRLEAGEPFYVKPSLDFIPSNYTPLYYYVASAVAAITGVGFVPLRLISILSSFASLAVVFLMVRRETGSPLFGLIGAGLFAASYKFVGAWFDLGRNDSLFLALLLAGAWLVRFYPRPAWSVAAAALIALSFFTKQTAAMIAPALVLYALLTNRRQFAVLTGSLAGFVAAGILLLNWMHDGWFYYYVFKIAGLHPFTWEGFHRFWRNEMLPYFGIAFAFSLFLLWRDLAEKRTERLFFHLLFLGATVTSSWMIRSHEGAFVNVLMPACAALSVTFGIGLFEALRFARNNNSRRREAFLAAVYLLAAVQFLRFLYNPLALLPTADDRRAGENLVRQLSAIPGEVWLTQHGYLAGLAGKRTYANAITIWDVIADKKQQEPGGLQEEILRSLTGHRFSAIVFDVDLSGKAVSKPGFIDRFYRVDGRLGYAPDPRAFRPKTGLESRPDLVYVPRLPEKNQERDAPRP